MAKPQNQNATQKLSLTLLTKLVEAALSQFDVDHPSCDPFLLQTAFLPKKIAGLVDALQAKLLPFQKLQWQGRFESAERFFTDEIRPLWQQLVNSWNFYKKIQGFALSADGFGICPFCEEKINSTGLSHKSSYCNCIEIDPQWQNTLNAWSKQNNNTCAIALMGCFAGNPNNPSIILTAELDEGENGRILWRLYLVNNDLAEQIDHNSHFVIQEILQPFEA